VATFKQNQIKAKCNCGKPQIIYEVNFPININTLQFFSKNNFIEKKSYTKIGIMYVENREMILIGTIGSNRIEIKCKVPKCNELLNSFEDLLSKI
jgi:hypothetical protein